MKAIILAAGQGTRMRSGLQKFLHPILGKTILQYIAEAAFEAGIEDVTIVVSPDGVVKKEFGGLYPQLNFAVQETPLGTGHAIMAGMERVGDNDDVLVMLGDMPLVTGEFIRGLKAFKANAGCQAVVTAASCPGSEDLGRVYADADGRFLEIVEARDMKAGAADTEWINTGYFLINGGALKHGLSKLDNKNSQNEYYATDIPKILREDGFDVRVYKSRADMAVFTGINTQVQLAEAVGHMRRRINERHMLNGVRMIDPATVYIDDMVEIEQGTVIYPGVILEGECKIGANVTIGANSHLTNTSVGAFAHIRQSVMSDSNIGAGTTVGPFAYLRPDSIIGEKCKVGSFVEVKNANVAAKSKIPHLSYVGDADVGTGVNIGCGAITANYDGKNKHRTVIGDGVFVGSNVNLVAPVKLGDGAFVAAGSTITKDVPSCALGIARARQEEKLDWNKAK